MADDARAPGSAQARTGADAPDAAPGNAQATDLGPSRPIGVIGAGTMGAGIAQVAAVAGHPVVLFDVAPSQVELALGQIAGFLRRDAAKGRMADDEAERAVARITGASTLDACAPCALVVEAAPERLALKQQLFADLEGVVAEWAVLATNTSTLSVAAIGGALKRPERLIGLHFFNPVPLMPLVEVIRGPATDEGVVAAVAAMAARWGKTPVLAKDTPGFIVNRVARPFYGEALRLLGEGTADAATIDALVRDGGFPMGPFELMDLIGVDVNYAAASSVFEGFFGDPRFRPHPIQRAMVESGRLGRKSGRGYFAYPA